MTKIYTNSAPKIKPTCEPCMLWALEEGWGTNMDDEHFLQSEPWDQAMLLQRAAILQMQEGSVEM